MLLRPALLLSLSAVLLAGCGDDDTGTGSAAAPPAVSTPAPVDATPTTGTSPDGEAASQDEQKIEKVTDESKDSSKKKKDAPAWVNAVNDRCEQHQADTTKVINDFEKKGKVGADAASDAMSEMVPLGRSLVKDLRDVDDVPGDVQPRWTKFLDTLEGAFDLMPKLSESLTSGKPDEELIKQFADVEKNTRPFAEEYGLTKCLASGGSA